MSRISPILLLSLAATALYLLHPPRELTKKDPAIVEIYYSGPGGPVAGAFADAVREFERRSDREHQRDPSRPRYRVVSGQEAARDQVADPTRFLVSVAGRTPPDVIQFDRYAIAEWAARGGFAPLDEFIERDRRAGVPDAVDPQDYFPACWDEAVYEGRVYGVPISTDTRALFYNKDLLRRAGLVDERGEARPPRTWEELRDASRRLTERDARGRLTRIGFHPIFGNSWLYLFGWMNGGEFLSPDGRTCTLNDPRIVDALAYMRDIYRDAGGFAEVLAFQASFQGNERDPFMLGQVAMKIDNSNFMTALGNYGKGLNFGVAPPPLPQRRLAEGVQAVTWSGGWALAIPSTARNKEAAWEFIRFMAGREATFIRAESDRATALANGRFFVTEPHPRKDLSLELKKTYVDDNPDIPLKYKQGAQVFIDLLPHSRFRPVTPVGQLLWNEHVNAMQAALYERSTPQKALDDATASVQRSLDAFYGPKSGTSVRSWRPLLWLYGLLVVASAAAVYWWDTRRRAPMRRLHGSGPARTGPPGLERSQWIGGWVCALPWIIGFIVFGGGPMLFSLVMSFCDYDILNPARVVGLDNYRRAAGDELARLSLWNTAYMLIGVPLGMVLGLGIALLLNQAVRGVALWRTLFYLPAIVPLVASSVLWLWVLNPRGGLINSALAAVGIEGPLWLNSQAWAKPSIILMGLWGAGGGMIIWLAGLKGIPQSLYEAASVDGATTWQQFRSVTIPQLTPYIFFNLVMGLIGTLQIFGQAFIMTQGGPVNSTLFYVYYLFNHAFRYGNMGYASALAWILFALVLVLTIVQLRLSKRWVHYESEA